MTARVAPNESFSPSHSSENPEQQGYTYDASNAVESEGDYVPEREFVLMPLFRRIGEMFGLRKSQEQEYIYVPEAESSRSSTSAEVQPEQAVVAPLQRFPAEETEPTEAAPIAARTTTEDILGLEQQSALEPETPNQTWASHEIVGVPQPQFEPEPESARVVEPSLPEPVLQQVEAHEVEFQPAVHAEAISPPEALIAAHAETPQPPVASAAITRQDASDLVAQIREAASKISAAVSQAAEWLHSKEEEILRRSGTPSGAEKPIAAESRASQSEQVSASPLEPRIEAPEWEDKEAPALQRERAWQDESALSRESREASSLAASQPVKAEARESRLQLVSKAPALPFWKRIDWAQQFAPGRVAILGAFVMAILMVLGISLARRPAASVLPQQTRTTIQPGGVTLTTHPVTEPAASSPGQSQRKAVQSHPAAVSQRHQDRRSSQREDGPEVVTHYYSKPKPSPAHQSTVAGVHHYSDMQ